MVAISASSSHSPSVSPSTSVEDAAAPVGEGWECGADRMVKIELEVAEALAGLAHLATPETHGCESDLNGGESEESESVRERVKVESPAGYSGFDPVDSVPESSNLAEQDPSNSVQKRSEMICNVMTKPMKDEQNTELKSNPTCMTSYASSTSRKCRQNLTEAEKEARRIRRVLANRESARQTIRRRQAVYEELTRKAADLAWENENLKREKELAVKKYDSLKSTNECLKAQTVKIVKVEAEQTQDESMPPHVEIATCPNSPFFICNQPAFFPFLWPSIIEPTNSVQLQRGTQNSKVFPSHIPMLATGKPDSSSYEKGNPIMINGAGSPLYLLPCPWLFTLPQNGNARHPPSFNLNEKPIETPLSNQYTASSSSKTLVHIENHNPLPKKVKGETPNSADAMPTNNLLQNSFGFPPDGGGQLIGSHLRGKVLMPAPLSCVRPEVFVKHENTPQLEQHTDNVKVISTAAGDAVNGIPEMHQDPVVCPSKKSGDVAAAAEARKKRKELTKLKSLHCRQLRMH